MEDGPHQYTYECCRHDDKYPSIMREAYDICKEYSTPTLVCYRIWDNHLDCMPREIPSSKFVLVQLPDFRTHSLNGGVCECFPPLESKVEGFRMMNSFWRIL